MLNMLVGTGIGMVLGAILGGVIASQISYISMPLGTLAGAGVLGIIGLTLGAKSS